MLEAIKQLFVEGYIYIFLYILIFITALLESIHEFRKYRNLMFSLMMFILFLFTGLRWETGTDWDTYKALFDDLELNWTFLLNVYSFDLGYVLLNALVRIFSQDYTVFLLIDSFLAVYIIYYFLKKNSFSPCLSLFVFYNAYFVAQFMGSNRRIIAMGALLFMFNYAYEKNKGRFAIFQLIGFLFHRSSIIGLVSWFIPRKIFSWNKVLIILGISLVIGMPQLPFKIFEILGRSLSFLNNQFVDKMQYYTDNNEAMVSDNINPIVQTLLSVIKRSIFLAFYFVILKNTKVKLNSLTQYFFNLYIIGFAFYIALNGSPVFQMLSTYFTFIEICLIGRIFPLADNQTKYIFFAFLFLYGLFQLVSAVSWYPELYLPYKSIFTK
ncbi:EpsG family protein [Sphingobacterium multivorum]|uniref:EpsG family protein n=1 Tax=Sphingobacterium multivorum TaxID=28454 RepID=UPI0028A85FB8|nr:EpsG family protein [Sphingobacterium multivorum]